MSGPLRRTLSARSWRPSPSWSATLRPALLPPIPGVAPLMAGMRLVNGDGDTPGECPDGQSYVTVLLRTT
jgi:hypothetical protein